MTRYIRTSIAVLVTAVLLPSVAKADHVRTVRREYDNQLEALEHAFKNSCRELRETYRCERDRLLDKLRYVARHYDCPHDRAIAIRAVKEELRCAARDYAKAHDKLEYAYSTNRKAMKRARDLAIWNCKHGACTVCNVNSRRVSPYGSHSPYASAPSNPYGRPENLTPYHSDPYDVDARFNSPRRNSPRFESPRFESPRFDSPRTVPPNPMPPAPSVEDYGHRRARPRSNGLDVAALIFDLLGNR